MNATLQAVLHSSPASGLVLRRLSNQWAPHGGQNGKFRQALRRLVVDYVQGVVVDLGRVFSAKVCGQEPGSVAAKYDVIVPAELLVELVALTGERFAIGRQHDAADFLCELLGKSGLAALAFDPGETPTGEALVCFPEFSDKFAFETFVTSESDSGEYIVDVGLLLTHGLSLSPPTKAPDVLVIRLPQYIALGGSAADQQAKDSDITGLLASLEDVRYWLGGRCKAMWDSETVNVSVAGVEVTYHVRSAVVYHGLADVWPVSKLTTGHYTAIFCEAGAWYLADDSKPILRVPGTIANTVPDWYPYLVFLEREHGHGGGVCGLQPNTVSGVERAVPHGAVASAPCASLPQPGSQGTDVKMQDVCGSGGAVGSVPNARLRKRPRQPGNNAAQSSGSRSGKRQQVKTMQSGKGAIDDFVTLKYHVLPEAARWRRVLGAMLVAMYAFDSAAGAGECPAGMLVSMIEEFYVYGGHDCHHTVAGACLAKPAVQDRQLHIRLVAALGIPAKFLAIAMAIS